MGDRTGIQWTDATWSPVRGCSRVSEGCRNCYAERIAARFSGPGRPYYGHARRAEDGEARWTGSVRLIPELLDQPLRWMRPRRIFVNSMSDLFHEGLTDDEIDRVFAVMALAQRHTFQVLTKRPERMRDYLRGLTFERLIDCVNLNAWGEKHGPGAYNLTSINHLSHKRRAMDGDRTVWARLPKPPLPNVWLGCSVEDQPAADERIPFLIGTPATVRFVSAEPLLGPVDLRNVFCLDGDALGPDLYNLGLDAGISWVIAGGESGPGARPMHPAWARELRDQCREAEVPYFFKQWGEWHPVCEMTEDQVEACYPPRKHDRDEDTRSPRVPETVHHASGERFDVVDPGAWAAGSGAMQTFKVGKKAAGRLLDGVEWSQFPDRGAA